HARALREFAFGQFAAVFCGIAASDREHIEYVPVRVVATLIQHLETLFLEHALQAHGRRSPVIAEGALLEMHLLQEGRHEYYGVAAERADVLRRLAYLIHMLECGVIESDLEGLRRLGGHLAFEIEKNLVG